MFVGRVSRRHAFRVIPAPRSRSRCLTADHAKLLGLAVVVAAVWGIFLPGGIEYAYRRIVILSGIVADLLVKRPLIGGV